MRGVVASIVSVFTSRRRVYQLLVQYSVLCSLICLDSRVNLLICLMFCVCFCYHQSPFFPTVGVADPMSLWVLLLDSCPFLLLLLCLLCFLLDETQIWPGDLRVVCGCVGWL